MQGLYNQLLEAVEKGSWPVFSRLMENKGPAFDCTGFSYASRPLFNAVVSSICKNNLHDKRVIREHRSAPTEEARGEIAKLEEQIAGRQSIFISLFNHPQASRLVNAADFDTGETPIQIALEGNNLELVNQLFIKGVLKNSRLNIGHVSHCNLFMKALRCARVGGRMELLKAIARGSADMENLSTKDKTVGEIESQLKRYFVSLSENYSNALSVLISSNSNGENIYHEMLQSADSGPLIWFKDILFGNPISSEAEEVLSQLDISRESKQRILGAARRAEDYYFLKERKKLDAANVILSSTPRGLKPEQFLVSCLRSDEHIRELGVNAIIRSDSTGRYLSLNEIESGVDEGALVQLANAMVSHAPAEVAQRFFAGEEGSRRLEKLCGFHKRSDGMITEHSLLCFLLKYHFP